MNAERLQILYDFANYKIGVYEVMEKLGISRARIYQLLKNHKIAWGKRPEIHYDISIGDLELYSAGRLSVSALALTLGIRSEKLMLYLKSLPIPQPKRWSRPRPKRKSIFHFTISDKDIELYISSKITLKNLKDKYGVSKTTICRYLRVNKIRKASRSYNRFILTEEEARELVDGKITIHDFAVKKGVSYNTVSQAIDDYFADKGGDYGSSIR